MTNKQLEKRVDELERKVRDLEARPVYVPQPIYVPAPASPPSWQSPNIPYWHKPTIC